MRRKRGRPRRRWEEEVKEDLVMMGIRGWKVILDDREMWRGLLESCSTK